VVVKPTPSATAAAPDNILHATVIKDPLCWIDSC
jgi:hypothetical protein